MTLGYLSMQVEWCLYWAGVVLVFTILITAGLQAQELEPRLYSNTPVGMNFLLVGYGYSEGSVLTDPSVPLENGSVKLHGPFIGYIRSIDLWGKSAKVDGILAQACASGSAEFQGELRERDVCGIADPRFRLSVNLYGAPALTLKEFTSYKQDVIVGASMQVGVPLGQYDSDKLLNIGTNRWFIKPEIGGSKTIGQLTLESAGAVTFFTNNNNFLGGKEKEQDPLYSLQGHLVYSLKSGVWLAFDGTYYRGGQTTIDGVTSDDLQENARVGLTLAVPVNRYNSIKIYANTGVFTRTGGDYDSIGIAWQIRWGAGL